VSRGFVCPGGGLSLLSGENSPGCFRVGEIDGPQHRVPREGMHELGCVPGMTGAPKQMDRFRCIGGVGNWGLCQERLGGRIAIHQGFRGCG
jgi:hypothetical protein